MSLMGGDNEYLLNCDGYFSSGIDTFKTRDIILNAHIQAEWHRPFDYNKTYLILSGLLYFTADWEKGRLCLIPISGIDRHH